MWRGSISPQVSFLEHTAGLSHQTRRSAARLVSSSLKNQLAVPCCRGGGALSSRVLPGFFSETAQAQSHDVQGPLFAGSSWGNTPSHAATLFANSNLQDPCFFRMTGIAQEKYGLAPYMERTRYARARKSSNIKPCPHTLTLGAPPQRQGIVLFYPLPCKCSQVDGRVPVQRQWPSLLNGAAENNKCCLKVRV